VNLFILFFYSLVDRELKVDRWPRIIVFDRFIDVKSACD
jgi:hypothetical protein